MDLEDTITFDIIIKNFMEKLQNDWLVSRKK